MGGKTYTDLSYEIIGGFESRKRWQPAMLFLSLWAAIIGLVINAVGISYIVHQKGGPLDLDILITMINIVACSLLLLLSVHQYVVVINYKKGLRELEALEDKIHQEVFKSL